MINFYAQGYQDGYKFAAPGTGVAPIPAPPKVQSPVISSQLGSAVSKPPPKPPTSNIAPPAPPSQTMPAAPAAAQVTIPPPAPAAVGQLHMTTETATNRAKQSDFQLRNGEDSPLNAKKAPDNGEVLLGRPAPEMGSNPDSNNNAINHGFDALKVQRNFDLPNPGMMPLGGVGGYL